MKLSLINSVAKVKTFCKWSSKDIEKKINLLAALTEEPRYACKKCARVTNNKKAVCKPIELPVLAGWR